MAGSESFDREVDPQAQIRRLIGVVKRGWLPLVTCLGTGLLIGIALWYFIPKAYISTAKLILRSEWMFAGVVESKALDDMPFSARSRQLEDELRSTTWVEAVLDKLEWDEWSRARGDEMTRRLFVNKVKSKIEPRVSTGETGERLVFVNFTWHERHKSSDFCEKLTEHWLETSVLTYSDEIENRLAVSEDLLAEKKQALDEARRALETFETRQGISGINQRQDSQMRADTLRLEVDRLETQIAGLQAQVDAYDAKLAATNAEGALLLPPTLPESSAVTNPEKLALLTELTGTLAEIDRLQLAGYTDKWPRLKQLKQVTKELLIRASVLENTILVDGQEIQNPDYLPVKAQLDALQIQLDGLAAQRISTERVLAEVDETLATLPEVLRKHSAYQQDVATATQVVVEHQLTMQPLRDKKASLARKGEGQLKPYAHIEKPMPAPAPASAIGWLALAISTLAGLGVAVLAILGREFLRSSFGTPEQARKALRLPVLGEAASIRTREEIRRGRMLRTLQVAASFVLLIGISAAIWVCVTRPEELPRGLVEWAMDLRDALS
jgi:hypothetical protein